MSIQLKKLSLDGNKREVLTDCLTKAAAAHDADMGRIYINMIKECSVSTDRMLLNSAQLGSAKWALRSFGEGRPEAEEMLDQIALTRKAYTAKYTRKEEAAVMQGECIPGKNSEHSRGSRL